GTWDDTGCTRINFTCHSTHLTYFSILMTQDYNSTIPVGDLKTLTYITYIGCGLSAAFTAIVVLIELFLHRKVKPDHTTMIHTNLSASLFVLNMAFLMNGAISYFDKEGPCRGIAIAMHYGLLSCFSWMAVEAFHLYLLLVKVMFTQIKLYMKKLCLFGWGVPAVVVAAVAIADVKYYAQITLHIGSETEIITHTQSVTGCWIEDKIVFYTTVIGYFAVMFLFNTSILIVVCVKIIFMRISSRAYTVKKLLWKDIVTFFSLTILTGTTWGLAFFAQGNSNSNVAVHYLFTILNSIQGFLLFLWLCIMKVSAKKEKEAASMPSTCK
uniref:G-protein coupled receptors family 2 profile 2 domain-containing protein n=1 Tax=Latimeria chalumnae TaxID=7897 RepID=H3A8U8_LATCH